MNNSTNDRIDRFNKVARHIGITALDGLDIVICTTIGALGAVAAYHNTVTVTGEWRPAIVGAAAVVGAILGEGVAQRLLGPLRRRLYPIPAYHAGLEPAAGLTDDLAVPEPRSVDDHLTRLLDGEHEYTAAVMAYQLDRAGVWLTDSRMWQGHRAGASMHLADGVRLVWHAEEKPYTGDQFTLAMPGSRVEASVRSAHEIRDLVVDHLARTERHHRVAA